MSRPDLVSMLLDVSIDPCDGSVHPSLQYVLIRGFSAMGWEQPKAASEDMAMEILKMIRPSSSNLASGGKVASREYPALGDRVATLLEDARCPKVTPAMEEAGRECARSNDPSTFADIFEAMWKARPTARPDTAEARLREAHSILCEPRESQASDNLEGALYDIERFSAEGKPTDSVCINTLKRIMKQLVRAEKALSPPSGGDETTKSEGDVEGHVIPRMTSATTTRYPATEGERHMVAPARRAEEQSSTKTGPASIKPGPSEPSPPADRREIVADLTHIVANEFLVPSDFRIGGAPIYHVGDWQRARSVIDLILAALAVDGPNNLRHFVLSHWDNQDMNHADFRVHAYQIAAASDGEVG